MTKPNKHCWYELITTDQDAAEKFYADVVGWGMQDSGMPGMRYTIIHADKHPVGGVMSMENGPPPVWLGYIAVDDVDACAKRVTDAGGTIHKAPEDIPDVGRFAVVTDPQGAAFVLFTPGPNSQFDPLPYMTPGTTGWHELHTTDWEGAWGFYSGLFGWAKDEAMDMGAMGTYQLFKTDANPVGAMFNSPATPRPLWLYYFSVPSIEGAKAKVEAGGGKVVNGPMEVPGGMWVINATDPQGALFALVGPKT
jgi:predicted enzyme related to lactoylglutathione lyase